MATFLSSTFHCLVIPFYGVSIDIDAENVPRKTKNNIDFENALQKNFAPLFILTVVYYSQRRRL